LDDNDVCDVERKVDVKKIAISINTSWNVINFRLGLLQALQRENYEINVVAPYDEYSENFEKMGFKYHPIQINNKGTNPLEDIKLIIDYYRIYSKMKPDIILHYTIKPNVYGSIAANMLKIKCINNIAGLGTLFVKPGPITLIAKILYKISQKNVDKIFFQNKDDYNLFITEKLVEKNRCDILPGSGVNTDIFKPIKIEKKDNNFRFLLIARMLWDKGIGEYVEAARTIKKKHDNVEFQLLGFIDDKNKSAISQSQIDAWVHEGVITYLGKSDDVKKEISKADCIVLPSYYREGTPRVLLEAASMAKPIITTDNIGCRNVVDHGINGFLCKKKDIKDLTEKMEMMIQLPEIERIEMGGKGRLKIIKEFNEKIVIDKYLNVINSL